MSKEFKGKGRRRLRWTEVIRLRRSIVGQHTLCSVITHVPCLTPQSHLTHTHTSMLVTTVVHVKLVYCKESSIVCNINALCNTSLRQEINKCVNIAVVEPDHMIKLQNHCFHVPSFPINGKNERVFEETRKIIANVEKLKTLEGDETQLENMTATAKTVSNDETRACGLIRHVCGMNKIKLS